MSKTRILFNLTAFLSNAVIPPVKILKIIKLLLISFELLFKQVLFRQGRIVCFNRYTLSVRGILEINVLLILAQIFQVCLKSFLERDLEMYFLQQDTNFRFEGGVVCVVASFDTIQINFISCDFKPQHVLLIVYRCELQCRLLSYQFA